MTKKLLMTATILLLCFSFIGCNKKGNEEASKEKVNFTLKEPTELNEIDGILMRIKQDTLTRTSATIVIYDKTEQNHAFGNAFHIDKKENGNWVSLKTIDGKDWTELNWTLEVYYVDEHDQLEMNIGWNGIYEPLENGEYRIVKSIYNLEEQKESYFSVQFLIES